MAKYQYFKDELREDSKEHGEIKDGTLLREFLSNMPLVNPLVTLNGQIVAKYKDDEVETFIEDNYRLKSNDTVVIVNTLGSTNDIVAFKAFKYTGAYYTLNKLLTPETPSVPTTVDQGAEATEYSITTSQNQARNGQPIKEWFGTCTDTPDIISAPYRRFENNKQYLYMLLCLSVGQVTVNDVLIGDTSASEYASGTVDYRVYKTEASHTGDNKIKDDWNTTFSDPYMRDIVITSDEIQDYELTVAEPFNEIQLNPSGTFTDYIEFDILLNGLYADSGSSSKSVTIRFHITNSSLVTTTHDVTINENTIDPIRRTYGYSVTPDHYTVKAERITADSTVSTTSDKIILQTMKAYLVNNDTDGDYIRYGDMTLLAIKIKATQGISSKGQFKVKVKGTRDGISTLKECLEYVWTSDNGGRQPLNTLDLPAMNETYNYVLRNRATVFNTMKSIATSHQYNLFQSFNILTAKKDVSQPARSMIFNEANIVKGTFKISKSSKDITDNDGVRVTYKDADSFEDRFETFPLTASFPEDITLNGVTDQTIASNTAEFLYNIDTKRAVTFKFDTELDAYVPSLYERVGVAHSAISTSQAGTIVGFTANTVELNELPKETFTTPKILFRARNGEPSILYDVLSISDRVLTIDVSGTPLPADLYTGDDEMRTVYHLGEGTTYIKDMLITSIKPKKNNIISVTGVKYDESVYV